MTRAVGNGMIQTLANAIGTGAVGKLAKQVAGLSTDMANIKTPDKGSGLMFNPDTGKLYIPCGNGVTVNKNTGMLEVPIGEHLRYTGSGLDVPDADETTAGVVKLTHEVSNRNDEKCAVTADGVYAYAPGYNTPPTVVLESVDVVNGNISSAFVSHGFFFCNIYGIENWEADKPAITLHGYGIEFNYTYYGGITSTGTAFFSCLKGSSNVIISPQNPINSGTLFIMIPVYKL